MKTKRYGWVLRHKLTKKYAGDNEEGIPCNEEEVYGSLRDACVIPSRQRARYWREVGESGKIVETIVKVALSKESKPYKVIGRG